MYLPRTHTKSLKILSPLTLSIFFYTVKNKTTLLSEHIARHQLGTMQSADQIVFTENDDSFYIGVYRTKSEKYIIIYNSSTLVSDYHILSADNPQGKFKQFSPREIEHEYSIEHYKDKFYIVTNWNAMNFRLMETFENKTEKQNWKEVISHRKDVFLNDTAVLQASAENSSPASTDFNFQDVKFTPRFGTGDQTKIPGIESSVSTTSVGVEVTASTPVTRQITNTNVDAVKVSITFPQLQKATDAGDLLGSSVQLKIAVQ